MNEEGTRAYVRFRLPNGELHELEHGDIIGRLWSAALFLDNPRVSEAHAMVSLRHQTLRLLALRGRFAVDGALCTDVELTPGLAIQLARDLTLTVDATLLPTHVLAIEGDALPRHTLSGVCSLRVLPTPEILPGEASDADIVIWGSGLGWSLRHHPTDDPRPLLDGDTFTVHDHTFRAVAVQLAHAGQDATLLKGGLQSPLTIEAHYDSAHIRTDHTTLSLSGVAARILCELVAFKGPVDWRVLAGEVWREDCDEQHLRRRLDVNLARLRKRLREAHVRPDLVRANGAGHFELFLHPRDRVLDRT